MSNGISLSIDLRAFNEGLKSALKLTEVFTKQFNGLMNGNVLRADTSKLDKELESAIKRIDLLSNKPIDLNEKPAVEALDKTGKKAVETGDKLKKSNLDAAASYGQIITGLNSVIMLLSQATAILDEYATKTVEADQANIAFKESLKAAGIYSDEYYAKMQKYIDAVQDKTGVDDENIKMSTKMMLNMHKFSQEELPAAIEAAVGLSKVYEVDLNMAMQMLGRTAGGLTARLQQFGVASERGGDQTVNFAKLMKIGADGFAQTEKRMDGVSGAIIRQRNNLDDLKQEFGLFIYGVLNPFMDAWNDFASYLKEHGAWLRTVATTVGLLSTAVVSYLVATKGVVLVTKTWAVAQTFLNTVMKANPVYLIISLLSTLAVGIYAIYRSNENFARSWDTVWRHGEAAVKILWEYLKGFGIFIINFATAMTMSLVLPFKLMYDSASAIFGKLAAVMKKLVKGDFKGVWAEIASGVETSSEASARAVLKQYQAAFAGLEGLGTKAKAIWAGANTYTIKMDANGQNGPNGQNGRGAGAGDDAAAKAAAQKLLEELLELQQKYSVLAIADEYERRKKELVIQRDAEVAKATELKASEELIKQIKDFYAGEITKIDVEAAAKTKADTKAKFEADIQMYSQLADMGIMTYDNLKQTYQDYLIWAKTNLPAGEIALLEAQLDQINLKWGDNLRKKWRDNNQVIVQAWDGVVNAFKTGWDVMLDKTMTGSQKWHKITQTMLGSWYNSMGNAAAEWVRQQMYSLFITQTVDTAKTETVAAGETARTVVTGKGIAARIGLEIIGAIKYVAIKMWEIGVSMVKFYSFLGPFAVPAALATMAGIVGVINTLRKGFFSGDYTGDGDPTEVAGQVHKKEFVFDNQATAGNVPELRWLQRQLRSGVRLMDIIMPSVRIPFNQSAMPNFAMSYAGGSQTGVSGVRDGAVVKAIEKLGDRFEKLKFQVETEVLNYKIVAKGVEKANRKRTVIT